MSCALMSRFRLFCSPGFICALRTIFRPCARIFCQIVDVCTKIFIRENVHNLFAGAPAQALLGLGPGLIQHCTMYFY